MKVFFDTEFTDLNKDCELISIGLTDISGNTLYCEISDFDINKCNDFVKETVISNLKFYGSNEEFNREEDNEKTDEFITHIIAYGSKKYIADVVRKWLTRYHTVEWVSDCCHYDMVLLIDLLYHNAINVPYKKIGAACHELNNDIAKYLGISELNAFDVTRENIVSEILPNINDKDKHNALHDAIMIKYIYLITNDRM